MPEEEAPDNGEESSGDETSETISKYKEPEKKSSNNLVNQALEAADALKKQNKIMAENIRQLRELQAVDILGGRSEAGMQRKEKTEDEKAIEEANKILGVFE